MALARQPSSKSSKKLNPWASYAAEVQRLELFQDCGCPKNRVCICAFYKDGCQKCDNCMKNRLYYQETGNKGERPCKLATPTDSVKITKYRIEFPRTILALKPSQEGYHHTARMLLYTRQVVKFALKQLGHEESSQAVIMSQRANVTMQAEDPLEQFFTAGASVGSIDTALAHGTQQRVRADLVFGLVYPSLNEAYRSLFRVQDIRRACALHLKALDGASIVRVARGFLGRCRAKAKRLQLLRHFGALRIQALWRGYWDRTKVIPRMWEGLRQRSSSRIQRQWRRYIGERTFRMRTKARAWRKKVRCAIKIQAVFRGFRVRKHQSSIKNKAMAAKASFENDRRQKLAAARARREAIKTAAAINIQRVWRGVLGRRFAYGRRQAGSVSHPRLAALADSFLASGDLWGFLAAVNGELEKAEGSAKAKAYPTGGSAGGSSSAGYVNARPGSGSAAKPGPAKSTKATHGSSKAVTATKTSTAAGTRVGDVADGKEASTRPGSRGTGRPGTAATGGEGESHTRVPASALPGALPRTIPVGANAMRYSRGQEIDPYAPLGELVGVRSTGTAAPIGHVVQLPGAPVAVAQAALEETLRASEPATAADGAAATAAVVPARSVRPPARTVPATARIPATMAAAFAEPSRTAAAVAPAAGSTAGRAGPMSPGAASMSMASSALGSPSMASPSLVSPGSPGALLTGVLPPSAATLGLGSTGTAVDTVAFVGRSTALAPDVPIPVDPRTDALPPGVAMPRDPRGDEDGKHGDFRKSLLTKHTVVMDKREKKAAREATLKERYPNGKPAKAPADGEGGADGEEKEEVLLGPDEMINNPPDGSHPLDRFVDAEGLQFVDKALAARREKEEDNKVIASGGELTKAGRLRSMQAELKRLEEDPLKELERQQAALPSKKHGLDKYFPPGTAGAEMDMVNGPAKTAKPQEGPPPASASEAAVANAKEQLVDVHQTEADDQDRAAFAAGMLSNFTLPTATEGSTRAQAPAPAPTPVVLAPSAPEPEPEPAAPVNPAVEYWSGQAREFNEFVPYVPPPAVDPATVEPAGTHHYTEFQAPPEPRPGLRGAAPFVLPLIDDARARVDAPRTVVTVSDVKTDLKTSLKDMAVIVNRKAMTELVMTETKVGWGKWSRKSDAGLKNVVRRHRRASLANQYEAERKGWKRTRRASVGDNNIIEQTLQDEEKYAAIDPYALKAPLTRYAAPPLGYGMKKKTPFLESGGVRRAPEPEDRMQTAPAGGTKDGSGESGGHAHAALSISSGAWDQRPDTSPAAVQTWRHQPKGLHQKSPRQRAVSEKYRAQALAVEARNKEREVKGELDSILNSTRGFGMGAVIGEGGAESAMIDVEAVRQAAAEAEASRKKAEEEANDPFFGMTIEEKKKAQNAIIQAKLTAAEDAGVGLEEPYDDGWRSKEEREEAAKKRAEYIAFTQALEADRAKAVAGALVRAMVSTIGDRMRHIEVTKRAAERGHVPSVLINGPERMVSFTSNLSNDASGALQPDLYRATGRVDAVEAAHQRLVYGQDMGTPLEGSVVSKMEALAATADPVLRRGLQKTASHAGMTLTRQSGLGATGSIGGAGMGYAANRGDMQTAGTLGGSSVATFDLQPVNTADSSNLYYQHGGPPSTADGTYRPDFAPAPASPSSELQYAGGERPDTSATAAAYGFDGLLPGSPNRTHGYTMTPGGRLEGTFTAGSPAGEGVSYVVDPTAVYAEEASLRAHGLGVPAVRTLLVDVRGTDGPIEPLMLHALLRTLPVPRACIDAAKADNLITPHEHLMLLRVAATEAAAALPADSEEVEELVHAAEDAAVETAAIEGGALPSSFDKAKIMLAKAKGKNKKGGKDKGGKVSYDSEGRRTMKKKDAGNGSALDRSEVLTALPPLERASAGEVAARIMREMPPKLASIAWRQSLAAASAPYCNALRARGVRTVADLAYILSRDDGMIGMEQGPMASMSDAGFTAVVKRLMAVLLAAQRLTVPAQVKSLYNMKRGPNGMLQPTSKGAVLGGTTTGIGSNASTAPGAAAVRAGTSGTLRSMAGASAAGGDGSFSPRAGGMSPRAGTAETNATGQLEGGSADGSMALTVSGGQGSPTATSHGGTMSLLAEESKPDSRARLLFSQPDLFTPYASVIEMPGFTKRRAEVAAVKPADQWLLPPQCTVLAEGVGVPSPAVMAEQLIAREEQERRDALLNAAEVGVRTKERAKIKDDLESGPGRKWLVQARHAAAAKAKAEADAKKRKAEESGHLEPTEDETTLADFMYKPPKDSKNKLVAGSFQVQQQKRMIALLANAPNPFRRSREERLADVQAVIERRLKILLKGLKDKMHGLGGMNDLDAPLEGLLIQAAFLMPLPSPKLVAMARSRAALMADKTLPKDTADDRARALVPFDVFLSHLAVTKPLSDVLFAGLKSTPNVASQEGQQDEGITGTLPTASAVLEPLSTTELHEVVDRSIADLLGRSKGRMLVSERAKAAALVARPWVEALAKWGYTKMSQVYRTPARELEFVLKNVLTKEGKKNAAKMYGPSETDDRAVTVACAEMSTNVPAYGIALLIESCMEAWVKMHPWAEVEMLTRANTYDRRYLRGPEEPRRGVKKQTKAEAQLEASIGTIKHGFTTQAAIEGELTMGAVTTIPGEASKPSFGLGLPPALPPVDDDAFILPGINGLEPTPSRELGPEDSLIHQANVQTGPGSVGRPSRTGVMVDGSYAAAGASGASTSGGGTVTFASGTMDGGGFAYDGDGGRQGSPGSRSSTRGKKGKGKSQASDEPVPGLGADPLGARLKAAAGKATEKIAVVQSTLPPHLASASHAIGYNPEGRTPLPPNPIGVKDPNYKPATPYRTLRDAKDGKLKLEKGTLREKNPHPRSYGTGPGQQAPPPEPEPPSVMLSPHGGMVFIPPTAPPGLPSAFVPTHTLMHAAPHM